MNDYDDYEKTSYETEPVEDIVDAMRAFARAFDELLTAMPIEFDTFAEEVRLAMYTPVSRQTNSADDITQPISLYEIGVTHSPNNSVAGQYAINTAKLAEAVESRAEDVQALLIQEQDGVLHVLCDMLMAFIEEEREDDLPRNVYAVVMRLFNECRRLAIMWE